MTYVKELLDVAPAIYEIAAPFQREVRPCHWISTPNGDEGSEWCPDCGYYMVRHLRRRDRKMSRDYLLDGGWRTENDHTCWCAGCGARLDSSLTDYGAGEELDYYCSNGFQAYVPEIAYDIAELVDHFDYYSGDMPPQNSVDCIALARAFLAGHHHQEVTQPGQWADDGGRE